MFVLLSRKRYKTLTQDKLTGLVASNAFDQRKASRYKCVWFFDIDGLKEINDRRGHAAGNAHIKDGIAELLQHFRRKSDYMVRWGEGDEFLVFSDRDTIPPLKYWSAGVAIIRDDLDGAIAAADAAMYIDKQIRKSRG
jgi:GGDEF domain-containing protein